MRAFRPLFSPAPRSFLRKLSDYRGLIAYSAVFAIIALPLFGHLDELPVQVWDEMRNGQNALEMNRTGKLIVTTYDYAPETWNTKPPLLIWILALSFRILGNNELALRLPSAVAAMLTCLLLLRFAKRHTGRWLPGILAAAILVTTQGYVTPHGTRTGDYDALLVLCTTAGAFWFFNYLEAGRDRWLYLAAAALTAGVLTKGVAGLFVLPAILAYALLQRKALFLLQQRSFYIGLIGFIAIAGGYYALREMQQPGYLRAVADNELGGRYNTLVQGINGSPAWIYFHELAKSRFVPWIWLALAAAVAGLATRKAVWRRVAALCILMAATILLILSGATTRAWWYMMPVYPPLALLCGMFITQGLIALRSTGGANAVWRRSRLLPITLLLTLMIPPYKSILDQTIGDRYPKPDPDIHDAGVYLKEVNAGNLNLGGNLLCGRDTLPFRWYQEVIRQKGQQLDVAAADSLPAGAKVLAWDAWTKGRIRELYREQETETFRNLSVFLIEGRERDSTGMESSPLITQ